MNKSRGPERPVPRQKKRDRDPRTVPREQTGADAPTPGQQWVMELILKHRGSGRKSWVFEFDGRDYRMNPAQGKMLAFLAEDTGRYPDCLVGWKSKEELMKGMGIGDRAFDSRLRRLRQFFDGLEAEGGHPPHLTRDLAPTCRRRGFRFLVYRPGIQHPPTES